MKKLLLLCICVALNATTWASEQNPRNFTASKRTASENRMIKRNKKARENDLEKRRAEVRARLGGSQQHAPQPQKKGCCSIM